MKNAPAMQFPYSSKRLRQPKCLQFGIISPDEMREMSVTQEQTINTGGQKRTIAPGITKHESYVDGAPEYGGVNDPRMGVLDRAAQGADALR